tara:strand:+ start:43 stop:270 length:228 start_codon:yes stop_codon:yes gene_type:complete
MKGLVEQSSYMPWIPVGQKPQKTKYGQEKNALIEAWIKEQIRLQKEEEEMRKNKRKPVIPPQDQQLGWRQQLRIN